MPTYKITTPNGTFKVNAPNELSDEEIQSYIRQASGEEEPAAPTPEAPKPVTLGQALAPSMSKALETEYEPDPYTANFVAPASGQPIPKQAQAKPTMGDLRLAESQAGLFQERGGVVKAPAVESAASQKTRAAVGGAVADASTLTTRAAGSAAANPSEAPKFIPGVGPGLDMLANATGAKNVLDAVAIKSATGGKDGLLEGMADPETGLLRTARTGLAEVMADQLKDLSDEDRTYWQKVGDAAIAELAAAGYLTASTLEDPAFLVGVAAQIGKKALTAGSKMGAFAKGVKGKVAEKTKLDPGALERAAKNPGAVEAAAGTEEALTYGLADDVTKIRKLNADDFEAEKYKELAKYEQDAADIVADYEKRAAKQEAGYNADVLSREKANAEAVTAFESETAAQKQGLERAVVSQRPGQPMAQASQISPYESGKRLETAAEGARKAIGTKYGARLEKEFYKSGIAATKVPSKVLTGKAAQKITGETKAVAVNPAQEFFDESLVRIGYDRAKGYQQQEDASKKAVDWLLERREGAGNIKTVEQILKHRQNFKDELFNASSGQNPLFPKRGQAAKDYRYLKSVYDEYNNLIAEIPAQRLGKEAGDTWRKVWKEMRVDYSEPERIISDLVEGIGKATDPEDFMTRIKDISVDDITAMRKAAATHKEIAPLVAETEQMAFDNMIRVSLDPTNQNAFSPEKFIRLFNTEDKAKLKALMGSERVARIQGAINKYKLPEKPTKLPSVPKPGAIEKPTLPAKPNLKLLDDEPAFKELAGASQEVNQGKIRSNIANMGQDPKVFAMRELDFLDNALGLKGKERYSERVMDAWAANKLGVAKGGKIPTENPLRTGYASGDKVVGGAAGGSAAGAIGFSIGGPIGASILAPIGMAVGHSIGGRLTSPSTAVAVYRAMNRLAEFQPDPKTIARLKAIRDAGTASAVTKLTAELDKEFGGSKKVRGVDKEAVNAP